VRLAAPTRGATHFHHSFTGKRMNDITKDTTNLIVPRYSRSARSRVHTRLEDARKPYCSHLLVVGALVGLPPIVAKHHNSANGQDHDSPNAHRQTHRQPQVATVICVSGIDVVDIHSVLATTLLRRISRAGHEAQLLGRLTLLFNGLQIVGSKALI